MQFFLKIDGVLLKLTTSVTCQPYLDRTLVYITHAV